MYGSILKEENTRRKTYFQKIRKWSFDFFKTVEQQF